MDLKKKYVKPQLEIVIDLPDLNSNGVLDDKTKEMNGIGFLNNDDGMGGTVSEGFDDGGL